MGALIAFQRAQVFINGKETKEVLVSNNKVYVSVAALREAGAVVSQSGNRLDIQFEPLRGRLQGDMIEGRIGEWLSNGTWRVRVSKVEPAQNPFGRGQGFTATVEFRNLTPNTISLFGSGLDKVLLLDDAGNQLSYADSSFQQKYRSMVRADGFTAELKFGDPNNQLSEVGQPDKLLVQFRSRGGKPALRGFRIFLKEPTVQEGQ
ncbi:MAG: hypothetical protein K6U77_05830 [Armatimonadetes bacterium]|nr:hypothetical protein [Armatimonadota bacterium]